MTEIEIPQGAKYAVFDLDKINQLWEKIQVCDGYFADSRTRDPLYFTKVMVSKHTHMLEFEGGMVWLTGVEEGLSGRAHLMVWDKKLHDKVELIKNCLIWGFLTFDLERIEVYVAEYARSLMRFIEKRLGFSYEGRLRRYTKHDEEFIDMFVYSLLRGEVLDG